MIFKWYHKTINTPILNQEFFKIFNSSSPMIRNLSILPNLPNAFKLPSNQCKWWHFKFYSISVKPNDLHVQRTHHVSMVTQRFIAHDLIISITFSKVWHLIPPPHFTQTHFLRYNFCSFFCPSNHLSSKRAVPQSYIKLVVLSFVLVDVDTVGWDDV